MRLIGLLLLAQMLTAAGPAKLTYTKMFPGSVPPYLSVSIERTGALVYKEAVNDEMPVTAQMGESDTASLFALAERLNYFQAPIESGLKVANTGKKTFGYQDEQGKTSEVVFNYSIDETAKLLLDRFERIAETERAYIDLDRTIHFDKLGVNDSLAMVESLWLKRELATPKQFVPLLSRIVAHDTYMHLARDRAARLRDEFEGKTVQKP